MRVSGKSSSLKKKKKGYSGRHVRAVRFAPPCLFSKEQRYLRKTVYERYGVALNSYRKIQSVLICY